MDAKPHGEKSISTWSNKWVYVRLDAPIINPEDARTADDWYFMEASNPLFKELFSLLLAAKKSQSKVALYIDGCGDGRPRIIAAIE